MLRCLNHCSGKHREARGWNTLQRTLIYNLGSLPCFSRLMSNVERIIIGRDQGDIHIRLAGLPDQVNNDSTCVPSELERELYACITVVAQLASLGIIVR